eukprot:2288694-Alexandrium_andersonii.AAC.1
MVCAHRLTASSLHCVFNHLIADAAEAAATSPSNHHMCSVWSGIPHSRLQGLVHAHVVVGWGCAFRTCH